MFLIISCEKSDVKHNNITERNNDVAYLPEKDAEIQRENLEHKKKFATKRFPCDTLALIEFVLNKYPEGTYLVDFDKTLTYNIPRSAVIYYGSKYIFGIVAKSKPGERLIEVKNIVGYDQSFIDLDSTELGTAFFYLTLFECVDSTFKIIWETPVPSHGGFNNFKIRKWNYNNTDYIKVNFHYGRGIGNIDYNYFLVDGLTEEPHLLMTYEGINFKRKMANVNNDKYPDYYEFIYYDSGDKIVERDSVAFIWDVKNKVYVNTRNSKQTRQY